MSANKKFIIALASMVFLNGCAVSKMLMAGYTPPRTIADLLLEQEGGELQLGDDKLSKGRSGISLENYKGDAGSSMDNGVIDDMGKADYMQPWQAPSTLFRPSFSHKSLADYAGQLSMQLLRNSAGMKKDDLIGVASFVRLDKSLQQTNILGNQLAEYFISEIQQFGLAVVDFKMTSTLNITQRGDFVFSREALKLAENMKMDHMLSGTMIDKSKGVQINARIISIENGRVVASASVLIPHFIAQSLRPDYISRLSATD
jgi:TolB-like protein